MVLAGNGYSGEFFFVDIAILDSDHDPRIVAIASALAGVLLFFFVPETFWDRTPRPRVHHHHHYTRSALSVISHILTPGSHHTKEHHDALATHQKSEMSDVQKLAISNLTNGKGPGTGTIAQRRQQKNEQHVGFADDPMSRIAIDRTTGGRENGDAKTPKESSEIYGARTPKTGNVLDLPEVSISGGEFSGGSDDETSTQENEKPQRPPPIHRDSWRVKPHDEAPKTPELPVLHEFNSPSYKKQENEPTEHSHDDVESQRKVLSVPHSPHPEDEDRVATAHTIGSFNYTHHLRSQPPKNFVETLKPWNGRLRKDSWLKAMVRPFILFAYPAVLWSALVYSLSVGWLIVLSESVSVVYRDKETYNFNALQTGLVYISPFVGGILGTAVAGKVSDVIVRFMSRRNDGVYEPEFRLVMAAPVLITTCVGLMGFGWSAQIHDSWIVPTVLFGVISFGCSLGSTTAITFVVDSYRVYAGEALVTLNFSKSTFTTLYIFRPELTLTPDILHGLVFSLFFTGWLESDGSKMVFNVIGGIQVAFLLTTIPMYIYGKRARMWTVRKRMMEKW